LNAAAQRTKVVELAENEGPQLRVEWGLEVDDIALDAPSIVGIEEPLTRPPKTWQEVKKTGAPALDVDRLGARLLA
jgi:hypothetical protein